MGNKIQKTLTLRSKYDKYIKITKLESEKGGPPFLLDKELESQLQEYVNALRDNKGVVNSVIEMVAVEGISNGEDRYLVKQNGGYIVCIKSWAKSFLDRMDFVKRRASTKAKFIRFDFDTRFNFSLMFRL